MTHVTTGVETNQNIIVQHILYPFGHRNNSRHVIHPTAGIDVDRNK